MRQLVAWRAVLPKLLLRRRLLCVGYPDQCLKILSEVVRRAREQSHPHDLAFALIAEGRGHVLVANPRSAQSACEAAVALSLLHELEERVAIGTCVRGISLTQLGLLDEGISSAGQAEKSVSCGDQALARPRG